MAATQSGRKHAAAAPVQTTTWRGVTDFQLLHIVYNTEPLSLGLPIRCSFKTTSCTVAQCHRRPYTASPCFRQTNRGATGFRGTDRKRIGTAPRAVQTVARHKIPNSQTRARTKAHRRLSRRHGEDAMYARPRIPPGSGLRMLSREIEPDGRNR